ncbi:MAG: class I SAM-dependent methyltransferase [Ruminococcus sp.]|nr:class I SAM-dependent methyltransferase [Ruminococcus sp.]
MSDNYLKFFEDIKSGFKDNIQIKSLYDKPFSDIYNSYEADFEEVALYLNEAVECGQDILELCCGNGRITLPLARNNFNVTGVDCSDDMLTLLKEKKERMPFNVRKRINILKQDVFSLKLEKKFDMIILPATTICILFDDPEKTMQLFRNVAFMLKDHGKFLFDIRNYNNVENNIIPTHLVCGDNICLSYENIDKKVGQATGMFLTLTKAPNGLMQMSVAESYKKIIPKETIEKFISVSPFLIEKKVEYSYNNDDLFLYVLRKEEDNHGEYC